MQKQSFIQRQSATQKQVQKMSQRQIQAVRFLTLPTDDLREEIYKFVEENPALEIVEDVQTSGTAGRKSREDFYERSRSRLTTDEYQNVIENQADETETLQEHLLHQLNMLKISNDEKSFCTALIYNLDKNGCYGNQTAPEVLLSQTPLTAPQIGNAIDTQNTLVRGAPQIGVSTNTQNALVGGEPTASPKTDFINKCLWTVQNLDPIGCCCKNLEESLFIQAKILNPNDTLSLFILDGNLEMMNPPQPNVILKKIKSYQTEWHKKAFAPKLPIDSLNIDEDAIEKSVKFILSLNPHPAADYSYDSTKAGIQLADIALVVTKKEGSVQTDDYEKGIVRTDDKTYFKITYPSGNLPTVRIAPEFLKKSKDKEMQAYREKYLQAANDFLGNLMFRESTIVLQGCEIVKNQIEFFLKGPGNLKPFTRRQLAKNIGVHESTVSRVSSKHNSRFVQTDWGTFPLSYFFTTGLPARPNSTYSEQIQLAPNSTSRAQIQLISSESIKLQIARILAEHKKISDQKIADLLNEQGIKIARRTVTKYRHQL